ncbi:MAG: FAD-dependent oxidoreductase [Patescibacteria group bacterium]
MYDTIIIGAGPAGLTALLYLQLYGFNACCLGDEIGGKLLKAPDIVDFPGILNIKGADFIDELVNQIPNKTAIRKRTVKNVTKTTENIDLFKVETDFPDQYLTKTIVISAGNGNKQKFNHCAFFIKQLNLAQKGNLLLVNKSMETNISGVFGAGDSLSYPDSLEQLGTAVATGIRVASAIFQSLRGTPPPIVWGKSAIPRKIY